MQKVPAEHCVISSIRGRYTVLFDSYVLRGQGIAEAKHNWLQAN